ncbi:MAG: sporulation protein YqfD [Clostridia bacterium]
MWNYFSGYVIIKVEGRRTEVFINAAGHLKIELSSINRINANAILCRIHPHDFKKLRPIAKRTGCRIRVVKKTGLPFFVYSLRFRLALVICSAVAILAIIFASRFIFRVDISGCDKINVESIKSALVDIGCGVFSLKSSIMPIDTGKALMELDKRIAWAGVSIDGVILRVEIVEAKEPPDIVDTSGTGDIIAGIDGIITYVEALSGRAVVKVGDAVKKGDVLISGTIGTEETSLYTRARGTVKAKLLYIFKKTVGETEKKPIKTGRFETIVDVSAFSLEFQRKCEFSSYFSREIGDFTMDRCFLPIKFKARIYFELEYREALLYDSEKLAMALMLANTAVANGIDKNVVILSKKTSVELKNTYAEAIITVTLERDIGEFSPA